MSAKRVRTQVAIVGAGPAGLTLACLLHNAGIESVVLENRSRQYVEERIRAGVLEQGTVEVLDAAGVGARMRREGIVHHGIYLQFAGERQTAVVLVEQNVVQALDLATRAYVLTEGKTVMEGTAAAIRGDADVKRRFLGEV